MVVTYGLAASSDQLVYHEDSRLDGSQVTHWIGTGFHLNCIRFTASLVSVLFGRTDHVPSLKLDTAIPSFSVGPTNRKLTLSLRLQDYDGQAKAEKLSRIIVVLFGVVGLIFGYVIQQFSQTVYILGAGLIFASIVSHESVKRSFCF